MRGRAAGCPERGRRCGTYDARERARRRPDVWQYETIVHCAVPRAGCPGHGVRATRMPREVRSNSHLAALFEAQVLVMALSGMTAAAVASRVRESDDARPGDPAPRRLRGQGGVLNWWWRGSTNAIPEGPSSVIRSVRGPRGGSGTLATSRR